LPASAAKGNAYGCEFLPAIGAIFKLIQRLASTAVELTLAMSIGNAERTSGIIAGATIEIPVRPCSS
jgi:hypothetical protein